MNIKTRFIEIATSTLMFFMLVMFSLSLFAQESTRSKIIGKVISQHATNLQYSSVKVYKTDSTLITSVFCNSDGVFETSKISAGFYRIDISFIGYESKSLKIEIPNKGEIVNIGTVILRNDAIKLDEVLVQAEADPIVIRGDTVEYNADFFKTSPDANVEKLLKKLPGVTVDRNGNIKANGEKIDKVTVDGRDFFNSDPKTATKNLPADAISKVQILDERSEQEKNSGIDDGLRRRIMNLVLKKDKKGGWFGNASLADGNEGKYSTAVSANHFNGAKQVNFIFGSNNISQGFTEDDARAFNSTGGRIRYNNGGIRTASFGGLNTGNLAGITKTNAGGFNFSDDFGKKNQIKFNVNYVTNFTDNEQITALGFQTIQLNQTYLTSSSNIDFTKAQNHKLTARLTAQLDKQSRLTFYPNYSYSNRESDDVNQSSQSELTGLLINSTNRNSERLNNEANLNFDFSLNREFKEKKGIISLSVVNRITKNDNNDLNITNNNYFLIGDSLLFNRNEINEGEKQSLEIIATISKPISSDKKTSLSLIHGINISNSLNGNEGLEFNPTSDEYDILIDTLSNSFSSKTIKYSPSLGWNKVINKFEFRLNIPLQIANVKASINNLQFSENVSKNYLNILPIGGITYKPKLGVSWSLSFNSSQNLPNGSNLLNYQYNPNPLNLSKGNPNLKRSLSYNTYLSHSYNNRKTQIFYNLSLNYNLYINSIGSKNDFDKQTGVNFYQYANVGKSENIFVNGSINFPSKLKNVAITPSFQIYSSKSFQFLNGGQILSRNLEITNSNTLNYSWKEKIELSLTSELVYNRLNSSAQNNFRSNFFSTNNTMGLSYEPFNKWVLDIDVFQNSYANQNVFTLNTGLKRYFMKKRQLYLEFRGFDMLNQNVNIYREFSDNSIFTRRTNGVRNFYYLKLNYKVNKIGNTVKK